MYIVRLLAAVFWWLFALVLLKLAYIIGLLGNCHSVVMQKFLRDYDASNDFRNQNLASGILRDKSIADK